MAKIQSCFLHASQRRDLHLAHRTERDRKVADRIKAVLLADLGKGIGEIAEFLLADEQAVRRHLREYADDGKINGDSGGSAGKLSATQAEVLRKMLTEECVATAAEAAARIKKEFGVKFSLAGVTALLHALGFSWKKCEGVPAKADPAAQAVWIGDYRDLKVALPPDEAIVFLDATHPTISTKLGYAWSPVGQPAVVPTAAGRHRVNVLGTLNPVTMRLQATFPETVDSAAMRAHFAKLRQAYPFGQFKTVHVVLDQGSYNRSEATKEAARHYGLNLVYLPPYSPNLNLIERLWKLMNEETRDNVFFAAPKDFGAAIQGFFKVKWRSLKHTCQDRFADNFQTFAKASF